MKQLARTLMVALSATLVILCFAQSPASADQLVVFKNGKAMRVKSTVHDGKWLKCEFEDKSFLSILNSQVSSVEEATLASNNANLRVNQMVAGSGGGGGFNPGPQGLGAGGLPPDVPAPAADDSAQEQADVANAIAEEEAARRASSQQPNAPFGSQSGPTGRRGSRFGGTAQPFQPFQQGGIQQPNQQQQSPFQNRSLTQRAPRANANGGPIRATNPNQPQGQEN